MEIVGVLGGVLGGEADGVPDGVGGANSPCAGVPEIFIWMALDPAHSRGTASFRHHRRAVFHFRCRTMCAGMGLGKTRARTP